MPQQRRHQDNAAKQRAYRMRQAQSRAQGLTASSGQDSNPQNPGR